MNVTGTQNVVRACVAQGVPRLVYASTTDVVWSNGEHENMVEEQMPYLNDEHVILNF